MITICIFGPTKGDTPENWNALETYLNSLDEPFSIITSTCKGWDAMGRRYASKYKIDKDIVKADIKGKGYERGVLECNDEMLAKADMGITEQGVNTTTSLDMVEKFKKSNKKLIFL